MTKASALHDGTTQRAYTSHPAVAKPQTRPPVPKAAPAVYFPPLAPGEEIIGRYKGLLISGINLSEDVAGQWVKTNIDGNRRESRHSTSAYARDTLADDWFLTGDTIKFDEYGKMIDGQHRCKGTIEANQKAREQGLEPITIETIVVRGLPAAVMRVLDHGRKRSIADQLGIEGKNSEKVLGAAARWLYIFKNGTIALTQKGRNTASELLKVVDKHPLLEKSAEHCHGARLGVPPGLLAAVHYVAAHLIEEPELANEFAASSMHGRNAYDGDPAHVWRERILREKGKKVKLGDPDLMRGTIHAWNLFLARQKINKITIPTEIIFNRLDYQKL